MRKIYLALLLTLCCAQNSFAEFQTITTLSGLEGRAFGNQTNKQTLNSLGEYPISKLTSVGEVSQISHVTSTYNGGTSFYALNSIELFHRYKFFSSKYLGITLHNSYKFGGLYNENENLGLMPKQDDY